MNWLPVAILWIAVIVVLLIRRTALLPEVDAIRYLADGALLVDVRNPGEFSQGHVAGAINLPLSSLPESVLSSIPDKGRVVLLHCQGGGRSALANRLLRSNGYSHAHNVGSYRRAERIARACPPRGQALTADSPPGL